MYGNRSNHNHGGDHNINNPGPRTGEGIADSIYADNDAHDTKGSRRCQRQRERRNGPPIDPRYPRGPRNGGGNENPRNGGGYAQHPNGYAHDRVQQAYQNHSLPRYYNSPPMHMSPNRHPTTWTPPTPAPNTVSFVATAVAAVPSTGRNLPTLMTSYAVQGSGQKGTQQVLGRGSSSSETTQSTAAIDEPRIVSAPAHTDTKQDQGLNSSANPPRTYKIKIGAGHSIWATEEEKAVAKIVVCESFDDLERQLTNADAEVPEQKTQASEPTPVCVVTQSASTETTKAEVDNKVYKLEMTDTSGHDNCQPNLPSASTNLDTSTTNALQATSTTNLVEVKENGECRHNNSIASEDGERLDRVENETAATEDLQAPGSSRSDVSVDGVQPPTDTKFLKSRSQSVDAVEFTPVIFNTDGATSGNICQPINNKHAPDESAAIQQIPDNLMVTELDYVVDALETIIETDDKTITKKDKIIKGSDRLILEKENAVTEKDDAITKKTAEITSLTQTNSVLRDQLHQERQRFTESEARLISNVNEVKLVHQKQIDDLQKWRCQAEAAVKTKAAEIIVKDCELAENHILLVAQQKAETRLKADLAHKNAVLNQGNQEIEDLRYQLSEQTAKITAQGRTIQGLEGSKVNNISDITCLQNKVDVLREEKQISDKQVSKLQGEITRMVEEFESFKTNLNSTASIQQSKLEISTKKIVFALFETKIEGLVNKYNQKVEAAEKIAAENASRLKESEKRAALLESQHMELRAMVLAGLERERLAKVKNVTLQNEIEKLREFNLTREIIPEPPSTNTPSLRKNNDAQDVALAMPINVLSNIPEVPIDFTVLPSEANIEDFVTVINSTSDRRVHKLLRFLLTIVTVAWLAICLSFKFRNTSLDNAWFSQPENQGLATLSWTSRAEHQTLTVYQDTCPWPNQHKSSSITLTIGPPQAVYLIDAPQAIITLSPRQDLPSPPTPTRILPFLPTTTEGPTFPTPGSTPSYAADGYKISSAFSNPKKVLAMAAVGGGVTYFGWYFHTELVAFVST